jgi:hypothetical protein
MKDFIHKLLKAINLGRRDWAVLLPALLLAFSIWLIHNLSLRYNDYLRVYVVAHCNMDGHSEVSANRAEVIARCRTTGYNVIRTDLRGRGKALDVTFKPSEMKHKEGDVFYLTSSDLLEYAHVFYGDDVAVEYFLTDTLFFRFPFEDFKRVPVQPVYSFSYQTQHMASGPLTVIPDSVTVYGQPFHLHNIHKVYTRPMNFSGIYEDIQGMIGLESIQGVRVSVQEVHYSQDVTRFVELHRTLPVHAVNLPADKGMIALPSVVDVTLKCVFPLQSDPWDTLKAEVDYNDFLTSLGGKCRVRPSFLSRGVIDFESEPIAVDCVIEERR